MIPVKRSVIRAELSFPRRLMNIFLSCPGARPAKRLHLKNSSSLTYLMAIGIYQQSRPDTNIRLGEANVRLKGALRKTLRIFAIWRERMTC